MKFVTYPIQIRYIMLGNQADVVIQLNFWESSGMFFSII